MDLLRGQEAFIGPPSGVQVGPGAVGGVTTPRSLVQHGDGKDGEERRRGGVQVKGGWVHEKGDKDGRGEPKREKMTKREGGKLVRGK